MNNNIIQSECEREIKKSYKNNYHFNCSQYMSSLCRNRSFPRISVKLFNSDTCRIWMTEFNLTELDEPERVILGVSACTHYELIIWCTVPISILYNIIGKAQFTP